MTGHDAIRIGGSCLAAWTFVTACTLVSVSPAVAQTSAVPVEVVELAASHILIQFEGAERATATRSKEEAMARAQEVEAKIKAGGDFEGLAKEYSDGPSGPRGGNLGVFPSNRMVPPFSKAVEALEPGQVSAPVETQFGYHIIRRNPIERVAARHILCMYEGSQRSSNNRSKEEALALCEEVRVKAVSGGDFAELAKEYSDGPSGPSGGELGKFGRGQMVGAFDAAVFGLEVGGISEVVETPFGYHIILRYE